MFLTIVDDKSCATWVYLLSDKSVVPTLIKEFIFLVENQFTIVVKVLRTDNDTEFINKRLSRFSLEKGILHQTSCVYTPQQNGLVECKHRHILNCARALRFHVGLPVVFWGDCLLTTVYLIKSKS